MFNKIRKLNNTELNYNMNPALPESDLRGIALTVK